MIKISKIEVQKNHKDRVNIFVDEEYYASMFLDTAIKYGIKKDREIDEDVFKNYLIESEQNIAFSKAIKYINSAFKTKRQMREYLKKKGYDEIVINNVIYKLAEYDFVNDKKFAESYVNTYKNKYEKNMLMNKLIAKGVSKQTIEEVLEAYDSNSDTIDKLIVKKIGNKEITNDLLTKCMRFLSSRGFNYEEINSAIKKYRCKIRSEEDESWD